MIDKQNTYILALVESKNISKAAQKIGITQSSLSKFLIRLEEKLGYEIFDRASNPLKLTPEGELYVNYVYEDMERSIILNQRISAIKGSPHGDLTIGITPWRSEVLLPSVLPGFMKRYPMVNVKVCEDNHENIYSMLDRNEIDFAIVNLQINYNEFIFEPVQTERILVAIQKDAGILKSIDIKIPKGKIRIPHIDFTALQDEPLIQLKPGQNLYRLTSNFIAANGYRNKVIFETTNIGSAYRLTEEGMGITFIPEGFLHEERILKKAFFFTTGSPILAWQLGVTYKIRMTLSDNARLFISYLKNVLNKK